MAFPDNNLELFELTEQTLNKINELGKVKLNHFDLSFHFTRDSNQLDKQLNFHLFIFDEEFSKTIYGKKYKTVEKMVKLLLSNVKSEYMYKNVREGLILIKIKNLKNQLFETLVAVKAHLVALNEDSERGVLVDVEEQRNNKKTEKNGMPFFVISAKCSAKKIDVKIPLASNASDWEMKKILKTLKEEIEG